MEKVHFRNYSGEDYDAVCDFLVELNREEKKHIDWCWARFEWMYEHDWFDKSLMDKIGLWSDGEKIIGAAIYDLYLGEAFCGALPQYSWLYPEILAYAEKVLSDESGISVAICDDSEEEIAIAEALGFTKDEQSEQMMRIELCAETGGKLQYKLPEGYRIVELDPKEEPYQFQWMLWRGFDHGEDEEEFRRTEAIRPQIRKHLNQSLSICAEDPNGVKAGYCCLWYDSRTDYAYVEPVCVAPTYRGQGIAKALAYEALSRVKAMGANCAYVISDMEFYEKLGFSRDKHFIFYGKHA